MTVVVAGAASTESELPLAPADGKEVTVSLRQEPMPQLNNSRLGQILSRYYREGLGGPDNWNRIESLKVSGTIHSGSDDFAFQAYQKKPDLIKMTIRGNGGILTLGYDGQDAWKVLPGAGNSRTAEKMQDDEARRFIHSAHFGNHLLYPFAGGKRLEYIDTVPVEGTICHQIRVTLATGYQVDYYIDIRRYLEIKVVNKDLRSGFTNSLIYDDYIREFGMPIAKEIRSFEEGKLVSTLYLQEVKVNSGVMPWMFRLPRSGS
ncbi:hypothetical protein [Coraliomargarita parva]|uniref:hypothetical protein n=1 Tax=Coraliomargarita parva TaxID=3014050 RepID=UPI0022B4C418|nr:hypothetical protein [Coraliomargarita parva]